MQTLFSFVEEVLIFISNHEPTTIKFSQFGSLVAYERVIKIDRDRPIDGVIQILALMLKTVYAPKGKHCSHFTF